MRKRGGRRNEWTNEWDARNEWIDQRAEWLNRFIWQIRLADRDCLFILFYFILFCFILFCYVFASNLVVESNIFEPVCTSTFFFSPSFFLTKHISRIYIYIYIRVCHYDVRVHVFFVSCIVCDWSVCAHSYVYSCVCIRVFLYAYVCTYVYVCVCERCVTNDTSDGLPALRARNHRTLSSYSLHPRKKREKVRR